MTLLEDYQKEIRPKLVREFGYRNLMEAPAIKRVVVNMGIGDLRDNKEEQEKLVNDLSDITGQRPALRRAKKSVAGFNIRQGQVVGIAVTLRGRRMYDFLRKLFNIVLPRLRDFRGVKKESFDKDGNYTIGLSEHTVFPEIDLGKVNQVRGLEITMVTTTHDKEKSRRLLEELGMPFERAESIKGKA